MIQDLLTALTIPTSRSHTNDTYYKFAYYLKIMEVKKEETKALEVTYRIEPMKTIEVTKEHSDRTARARTLAILRSSLFGRKRYQDIYITCSLNNLFNALRIAEFMHRRVPDLSMIISMPPLKIIEVYIDPEKPNDPSHKVTERKRI